MNREPLDPATIMFGMSEAQDRRSCCTYLRILGRGELARTLSSRMSSAEIEQLVELTAALMRRHLSEQEYHRLFLGDADHH